MTFTQEAFHGFILFPKIGRLDLKGMRGAGPSLLDGLKEEVRQLLPREVKERSNEEIAGEVEALLARMTLKDKIGQMSQTMASAFSFGNTVIADSPQQMVEEGRVGSILGAFDMNKVYELQRIAVEKSPLGIPLFFNADVIHGYQTIFPVPLAWSCSWNMDSIRRAASISAKEAAASGITYNHGPMVDVTRDPRWGRVVEGAGEDPFLGSEIAKALVQGYQGDSLSDRNTIIACLKHFVAYGAVEAGRDYNTVDVSDQRLREVYLPPFKAGVEAGAGSVMNSFNTINGIPVAGNKDILNTLLREELGFNGMVISDYGSISELIMHGVAKDKKQAAQQAINATLDIEMVTSVYAEVLPQLIVEGLVQEAQLDEAVKRILTFKYKTGIMDDPYRYIRPEEAEQLYMSEEHLQASLDLAHQSIVLLKNDQTLPLSPENSTIALIGPFSNSKDLLGSWQFTNYAEQTVTIAKGIEDKLHHPEKLLIVQGCEVEQAIDGGVEQAVRAARQSDIVILSLGEHSEQSGEAASRSKLTLPDAQLELAREVMKTGKPVIVLLTNGRPLVLGDLHEQANAIVETWYLGAQAGHAIADVLFGDYNPSGKLTMSFPQNEGQIPVYYNHFSTGRPANARQGKYASKYLDTPNDPLYCFGFGLSYTSYEYSDLTLNTTKLRRDEELTASITLRNVGAMEGEEIVQMYIQDITGSVVRPVKELKGFKKVRLKPGESQIIEFEINEALLKFHNKNSDFVAEDGEFKLFIGPNSAELQSCDFELIV
ncbi:beta-glucosidase BglX [Paenibacillus barcinonensis]|nr:beta-glucosidase BglX [Paenibacillus barcinonensis]